MSAPGGMLQNINIHFAWRLIRGHGHKEHEKGRPKLVGLTGRRLAIWQPIVWLSWGCLSFFVLLLLLLLLLADNTEGRNFQHIWATAQSLAQSCLFYDANSQRKGRWLPAVFSPICCYCYCCCCCCCSWHCLAFIKYLL